MKTIHGGINLYWFSEEIIGLPPGFRRSKIHRGKPYGLTIVTDGKRKFCIRKNPNALIPKVRGYRDRFDFNNPIPF